MPSRSLLVLLLAFAMPVGAWAQSLNVTQVGHLDSYPEYSDVWGYTAPGGVELAIIGTTFGTSFVNVTVPSAPVEVKFIPGPSSIWRDIKTYRDHAYISNETGDGIQVVSLANPLNPTLIKSDSTLFNTAHNVYVDSTGTTPILYAIGAYNGNTPVGTVLYSLANPANPSMVKIFNDFYIHDLYAVNGIAYAGAINSGFLALIDVSALPATPVLDTIITDGVFTHNTWLTADGNTCITTDEISGGVAGFYDVSNPTNVTRTSGFAHPDDPAVIIHNVAVNGEFAYISWYKSGLQILDATDPHFPQRVGYFDTFVGSGGGFDGNWGVYPFGAGGNIYVSDITNGLFILSFDPVFGRVGGTVRDSVTTALLPGTDVRVIGQNNSGVTPADAHYRFSLVPGTYDLEFSAFGYVTDTITVALADDDSLIVDVNLKPVPSGSISGFVGEFGSYLPLSGISLDLDVSPLTATTAGDGTYSYPAVPAGSYTLTASPFGYAPQAVSPSIVDGVNSVVNFTLMPSVIIDDLESTSGWVIGAVGDAASTGIWELADPVGTGGGAVQPEDDHTPAPGVLCFVTGASGGAVGANDVDGGATTLLSPIMDLSGVLAPTLRYHRWYVNDAGSNPGTDVFSVDVSNNGGTSWVSLEAISTSRNFYEQMIFPLQNYVPITNQMRIRFVARDTGGGSVVEAAIDDIDIYAGATTLSTPGPRVGAQFTMLAPAPNPFRASTRIAFELPEAGPTAVGVFDIQGRQIRALFDGPLGAGAHELSWDGRTQQGAEAASGIYFVRMIYAGQRDSRKVVLSR